MLYLARVVMGIAMGISVSVSTIYIQVSRCLVSYPIFLSVFLYRDSIALRISFMQFWNCFIILYEKNIMNKPNKI